MTGAIGRPNEVISARERERLLALARQMVEVLADRAPPDHDASRHHPLPGREELRLWGAARREIARRNVRESLLPPEYLGEPAWNILLDLFDMEMRRKRVSVSSACIASCAPATTALRYIAMLVSEGVILRTPDPKDKRKTYLILSSRGKEVLALALKAELEAEARIEQRFAAGGGYPTSCTTKSAFPQLVAQ